ncbi:MAG: ABC transporter ATP-binding protein [Planctomycetes bacterium]|jgi:ABC-2 type transport system ATP-binding protein|nr:ABC transporter ATP-binding protein [Planctomycetota bacterium]
MMVEIEHLSKYFGPVLAVSDVSLRIGRNEIVGLLGNNGAGKSTLMRMLTTFLPATSGRITVDGFDVLTQSQDVRRRIGYLPESIPLYPEMRVEEYLRYRAQLKGLDRGKVRPRIENVLGRCRLGDVRRRQCGTLSKGFRQRVGLADALLAEPALLILDEPTDGLDPGQKQEALALLRDLGREHTIVFSSHLLGEVESLVDRIVILRRGHLALDKRIEELREEADRERTLRFEVRGGREAVDGALRNCSLGDSARSVRYNPLPDGWLQGELRLPGSIDPREDLVRQIAGAGVGLRHIEFHRPSLNDRWNEINNRDVASLAAAPSA